MQPLANDHPKDPAVCIWSSGGSGLLQLNIWRDRPLANDHPEGPASCNWSSWGARLLQMIIQRDWPLAYNHPERQASCKWSSGGTGLLQMIIRYPHHPSHLFQDTDQISRTFLEQFLGPLWISVFWGLKCKLDLALRLTQWHRCCHILQLVRVVAPDGLLGAEKCGMDGMGHTPRTVTTSIDIWQMSKSTTDSIFCCYVALSIRYIPEGIWFTNWILQFSCHTTIIGNHIHCTPFTEQVHRFLNCISFCDACEKYEHL